MNASDLSKPIGLLLSVLQKNTHTKTLVLAHSTRMTGIIIGIIYTKIYTRPLTVMHVHLPRMLLQFIYITRTLTEML